MESTRNIRAWVPVDADEENGDDAMTAKEVKFFIGQLVHHRLHDYRGVIVDVDSAFALTDEWYRSVARSKPPKDQPWYRILVHDSDEMTYVAERNLDADVTGDPVDHPMLYQFFDDFRDGSYSNSRAVN